MKEIHGAELACVSNMGSVTSSRLFRKDGRVWVQVWTHFTARIEGLQEASNYKIEPDQFAEVRTARR